MAKTGMTIVAVGMLLLAACGNDDGSDVRTVGGDGGSVSASGSISASATGSATGVFECVEGDIDDADTVVEVDLPEWDVVPEVDEVPAGRIGFIASTEGSVDPHELVVVKGDDPEALPTDERGAVVEEELPEGAFIGEIEAFPPGQTCQGAFDLEPGNYVLFCNLVEEEADGTIEAHYAEGMTTSFTVTE